METTITDNTNGAGDKGLPPSSPAQRSADLRANTVRSSMDEWERRTAAREGRYRTAHITAKRLAEEAAAYLVPNPEDSLPLRAIYLQRAQASALASLALSQAFAS